MEKILIQWVSEYTGVPVDAGTKFSSLNYDMFDQAVTCDWIMKSFSVNVNCKNEWFITVGDLIRAVQTNKESQ